MASKLYLSDFTHPEIVGQPLRAPRPSAQRPGRVGEGEEQGRPATYAPFPVPCPTAIGVI